MDYVIKQRINDPGTLPPHVYQEEKADEYSSVCIVSKDNLYGIIDANNEELVSCEYDNITIIGFGLFQLVKNGKLGLARLYREPLKYNDPIILKRLIPCEYDVIDCPWHEEIVILRKDEPVGMSVRAYFTDVEKLTNWYSNYVILDRDIVELRNADGSYLFDARNGKMFLHHENDSFVALDAPFKDEDELDFMEVGGRGIVILAWGKKQDSIIYYNGKRTRQLFYEGDIHPIYKVTDNEQGHRPAVDGFILEEDGNMMFLSADCQRKGADNLLHIKAETRIETCCKDTKQTIVYPFSSKTYRSEAAFKEIFDKLENLFGSEFEEDEDAEGTEGGN